MLQGTHYRRGYYGNRNLDCHALACTCVMRVCKRMHARVRLCLCGRILSDIGGDSLWVTDIVYMVYLILRKIRAFVSARTCAIRIFWTDFLQSWWTILMRGIHVFYMRLGVCTLSVCAYSYIFIQNLSTIGGGISYGFVNICACVCLLCACVHILGRMCAFGTLFERFSIQNQFGMISV
jgi:hypothetical protein